MIIIILKYNVSLDVIEQHLELHRDFLRLGYEQGVISQSGPLCPRDGGIIVSHFNSIKQAKAFCQHDVFYQKHLACYQYLQFSPTAATS